MAKSKQAAPTQAKASSSKQATTSKKSSATANTSTSIDDIFAKPAVVSAKAAGKAKATTEPAAVATKPKVKKTKTSERAVETVLDPSAIQTTATAPVEKTKKRDRAELDEEEAFRDSRGDGPRRRTEEGYAIFKEAELKIDPTAGGTPLCPFDCDCCF